MLKKLIILLLVSSAVSVSAQDKSLGLRFGYLNSYMNGPDGDTYGQSQDGFFVSMYKDTKMFPFLFLQSGVEYTQTGTEIDGHDYKVNYLGIPASLKVKVGPIFAFAGASFNVKLSDTDNPAGIDNKWFDTNAFTGFGVELLMFTVDAKYVWGLTDVAQGLNNDGFQLGVGLRF